MKQYIPLWIKCPVALLLDQFGRLPFRMVLRNMRWSFTQNRHCSASAKAQSNLKVQRFVCRYLTRKYGSMMDELCSSELRGQRTEDAPVWVFWWQGLQDAPYLIQTCIRNIQKNAGTHPVYLVSQENYESFVDIPEHIGQKLAQGQISFTHFSDYLRMKLLAEHGGVWLDATVFVQKPIAPEVFQSPVWTVRNPGNDQSNISNWEWSISMLGGWKGNALFRTMEKVLDRYWAEHGMVATYFMTDCLIRILYDRYEDIRKMITDVPVSNQHYYFYQEHFNLPLDTGLYEEELNSKTWLYKITWKCRYEEQSPDGEETYYARWKREFGV